MDTEYKNYERLRTAIASFEGIMQALEILHRSGVDRTGLGCQTMAKLCSFLAHSLEEISSVAYDIHGD